MPTIEENLKAWNKWEQSGDEWSKSWGGTDMEWYFTILPRIHAFVPTETILEIAPGHGRWTHFLANLCRNLVVIDLSEKCIQTCKENLKTYSHITYHVNDGKSLNMIPDESVDFVFSFDSLVHVEEDVIEAYLNQLRKKLKQNGVGFIHHSNIGVYKTYFSLMRRIPECKIKNAFIKLGIIETNVHWRAHSMTASKFRQCAEKAGLQCICQEIINWGTKRLIDCMSVFTREDSNLASPGIVKKNKDFRREIKYIAELSKLYRR